MDADMVAGPTFDGLWGELQGIGRDDRGGYQRLAWTDPELAARAWFHRQAEQRGLAHEVDGNGNLWACWGDPAGSDAVVTGSHLDSVPDGGGYDGALGVASAFAAVDVLRARAVRPDRPIWLVAFSDEEGGRFGIACAGSRLTTGRLDPARAVALTDPAGVTLAEAMRAAGHDPSRVGPDEARVRSIRCLLELHVEQGRWLADRGRPLAVASGMWPHGRYRLDFAGEPNHAGTTRLADRRDPMLPFARAVLAARTAAERHGGVATIGRVMPSPNTTNVIPAAVHAWLDARAPTPAAVESVVYEVAAAAGVTPTTESWTPAVEFDAGLTERVAVAAGGAPSVATAAGHDAGILATAGVRTAMLFVRNPTGVSHAPAEYAERDDCVSGVVALAAALESLACR